MGVTPGTQAYLHVNKVFAASTDQLSARSVGSKHEMKFVVPATPCGLATAGLPVLTS
jgi:hypothetical protein